MDESIRWPTDSSQIRKPINITAITGYIMNENYTDCGFPTPVPDPIGSSLCIEKIPRRTRLRFNITKVATDLYFACEHTFASHVCVRIVLRMCTKSTYGSIDSPAVKLHFFFFLSSLVLVATLAEHYFFFNVNTPI